MLKDKQMPHRFIGSVPHWLFGYFSQKHPYGRIWLNCAF